MHAFLHGAFFAAIESLENRAKLNNGLNHVQYHTQLGRHRKPSVYNSGNMCHHGGDYVALCLGKDGSEDVHREERGG